MIKMMILMDVIFFSISEPKLGALGFDISIHSLGLGGWRKSFGPL